MARTKAAVRQLMPVARGDFQRCTIYPFEIKEILPEQKTIDIKKKL